MTPMVILFLLLSLSNLIAWRFGTSPRWRVIAAAPFLIYATWYWFAGGRAVPNDEPLWLFGLVFLLYFVTLLLDLGRRYAPEPEPEGRPVS
jgi:hypothetical protein